MSSSRVRTVVIVALVAICGAAATYGLLQRSATPSSKEELAREALAAATAGDLDRLVAMGHLPSAELFACNSDDGEFDATLRSALESSAASWKGVDVEIEEIVAGTRRAIVKGDAFPDKTCFALVDQHVDHVRVVAKVTVPGAAPVRRVVDLAVLGVDGDGRWYLTGLSSGPVIHWHS